MNAPPSCHRAFGSCTDRNSKMMMQQQSPFTCNAAPCRHIADMRGSLTPVRPSSLRISTSQRPQPCVWSRAGLGFHRGLVRVRTTAEADALSATVDTRSSTTSDALPSDAESSTVAEAATVSEQASAEAFESSDPFEALGVDPLLVAGLRQQNILTPSAIQTAAVPVVLSGVNCAIQSYTGSGKTLAFLLPVMTRALALADVELKKTKGRVSVQALIVSPSQEVAMQIVRVAQSLLPPAGKALVQQVIGGANPHRQREALSLGRPAVVVGTPGRLAEMVQMGYLRVHSVGMMVLDEADQLLIPDFREDITHLVEHVGKKRAPDSPRQTILASATLTESVLTKTAKWCPAPRYVTMTGVTHLRPVESKTSSSSSSSTVESAGGDGDAAEGADTTVPIVKRAAPVPQWGWGVKGWDGPASEFDRTVGGAGGVLPDDDVPPMPPQVLHYFVVSSIQRKADTLRRLIHARDIQRALVFVNFQARARDIQFKLQARNMEAAALHGELPKLQRASVLEGFRRGRSRVLVVSDVASRGLDVADCDAVVNLELPSSAPHYAHRAGRTGRMGAPGAVVSIVSHNEVHILERLGKQLGTPILEAHVANGQMLLGPDPDAEPPPAKSTPDRDTASSKGSSATTATSARDSDSDRRRSRGDSVASTSKSEDGAAAKGRKSGSSSPSGSVEPSAKLAPGASSGAKPRTASRDGSSSASSRSMGAGGVGDEEGDSERRRRALPSDAVVAKALQRSLRDVFKENLVVSEDAVRLNRGGKGSPAEVRAAKVEVEGRSSGGAEDGGRGTKGGKAAGDTARSGSASREERKGAKAGGDVKGEEDGGGDEEEEEDDEADDATFEAELKLGLEAVAAQRRGRWLGDTAASPSGGGGAKEGGGAVDTVSKARSGGGKGGVGDKLKVTGGKPKASSSSDVARALRRELEEIRGQKGVQGPQRVGSGRSDRSR